MAKSLFAAAELGARPVPGPRILVYHQIGAGLGREMEVRLDVFERQLDWLGKHYQVVHLPEAIARRGQAGSERLVVLTFDDGYSDQFEVAYPRLRDLGFPFTLYLTTQPVETGEPLTPGGRADPLTWEQVGSMLDSGLLTLGAHTHTHANLRFASAELVEEEVGISNDLIARHTGVDARHFTYPWGYWSPVADPIMAKVYDSATVGSGPPLTATTLPHRLNRIPIQLSDGVVFFKRKLASGLKWEDRARRLVSGYRGP
jgi:peptidoglycan/xylan/chitin deacetylase (PgdA/CDA1 family)